VQVNAHPNNSASNLNCPQVKSFILRIKNATADAKPPATVIFVVRQHWLFHLAN